MSTETSLRRVVATLWFVVMLLVSAGAASGQTQAGQATANYLPIKVIEDHLMVLAKGEKMTTFQQKQLQRKFFTAHKGKVFEGTIKCDDVEDDGRENVVITHTFINNWPTEGAILEVLIPKTDTASLQKAGQIKRGDNVTVRGILTSEPYFRSSFYSNVKGKWQAQLEKSSVLNIASSTK